MGGVENLSLVKMVDNVNYKLVSDLRDMLWFG